MTKHFPCHYCIRQYRQFYQMFPKLSIRRTLNLNRASRAKVPPLIAISDKPAGSKNNSAITDRRINPPVFEYALNWTHIQRIMRVSNPEARTWYLRETVEQSWDVRTLDRNISTLYYERLLMSQVKKPVIKEMR
jgi:hypothetical protein